MPTYQSPGVYVEEMEAGARPIEGVGTAVAAFVGLAGARSVQRPDPRHELEPVHLEPSVTSSRAPTCTSPCTATSRTGAAPPTWCASVAMVRPRRPPGRS